MKTFIYKLLATGFYTGYIPSGPGTFGTLVGVMIYILLSGHPLILILLLAFLFVFGIHLSSWAEDYFKEKDSKKIVIDEIAGYLITMAGIRLIFSIHGQKLYIAIALGFFLFRFFDIFKPFYIKKAEKIKGGMGVMLDDALAGAYAGLVLILIMFFG